MFCAIVQQCNNQFENSESFTANCWIIQEVLFLSETTSQIVVVDTSYQRKSWCAEQCELQNKIQNGKMKHLLNQLSFGSLFSQKFEPMNEKIRSDICIQNHFSRNPIQFNPNFPLIREFFGKNPIVTLIGFWTNNIKVERNLENTFSQLLKRKNYLDRIHLYAATFSSIYEQSNPQH